MADAIAEAAERRRYPTKAVIDRTVEAVRANGIAIGSITAFPDGSLRVSAVDDPEKRADTLFDELDKVDRL